MAATLARCTGHDKNREKTVQRLGSQGATGYVQVVRDGVLIHGYTFGPETETDPDQTGA